MNEQGGENCANNSLIPDSCAVFDKNFIAMVTTQQHPNFLGFIL
jgi:hypothetical protein